MRAGGFKTFWISFFLTLAVLLPLGLGVMLWGGWQRSGQQARQAAEDQSGVPVAQPARRHTINLLVAVADEAPAFVLARLDASESSLSLAAIPAEGVLLEEGRAVTLAEAYMVAGPARVARLLESTLGVTVDRYLAITPAALAQAVGNDSLRVGLSGAFSAAELNALRLSESVQDWTAQSAHNGLAAWQAEGVVLPPAIGRARAAFWGAAARQWQGSLPTVLPQGLRRVSGSLLTDLTAQDYYTLGETLEFLANDHCEPEATLLAGVWNAAAQRYEFTDETLVQLQQLFNAAATAGMSLGDSEP